MQFLARSLLLIQCTLVLSVYSQCTPAVLDCLQCNGVTSADACTLSADNKTVECQIPTSGCQRMTCGSSFTDTCMVLWTREDEATPWTITAGCLSIGIGNPCDFFGTCEHVFDTSKTIPSSLVTGTYICRCYDGDFCNQNFSADVSMFNPPISTSTSTIAPTPTVVNERDCITCQNVNPICNLSEDNRTLECSFDDECAQNTVQCTSIETCAATWVRRNASSPWTANARCVGGSSSFVIDQPTCQVTESYFNELGLSIPDSVETGSFICSCVGALCNREFRIDLNNFTSSDTTTTSESSTISVPPTISPSSEGPSTTRTSTVVPTTSSTNSNVTTGSNVNTDGMFAFMPVLFITYGLLFAYQYTDNLYTNQFEIQLSTIRV